ncbi:very short patch repair endonuclease [Microbacterium trichothecenolyticum]|uniref:very short patch repair endonuclease n=1 Tax=Microbacterium trichothecenolyticum TaxID=69370 RepID=UPI0035BE9459
MDANKSEPIASWASTAATRASMRSNRGRDTAPEMAIRRRLHALGLRYRVSARPILGIRRTADIVFPRLRIAVFIDGCFWHGCPDHYQAPVRNASFWADKRASNRLRDLDTNEILIEHGWTPLRFWEHEVNMDLERVVGEIVSAVRPELARTER